MKKILTIILLLGLFSPGYSLIEDELINNLDKNLKVENTANKKHITETQNSLELKVQIKENYSTKQKLKEGDRIDFVTVQDYSINNKLYKKGTIVPARLETISQNASWGVPSDLVVDNFSLDNMPLYGQIEKTGANRAIWLYPSVYIGCCFFGAGLLLIPIRGGHAKINKKEIFSLYLN